jgi:hypothetical protein
MDRLRTHIGTFLGAILLDLRKIEQKDRLKMNVGLIITYLNSTRSSYKRKSYGFCGSNERVKLYIKTNNRGSGSRRLAKKPGWLCSTLSTFFYISKNGAWQPLEGTLWFWQRTC